MGRNCYKTGGATGNSPKWQRLDLNRPKVGNRWQQRANRVSGDNRGGLVGSQKVFNGFKWLLLWLVLAVENLHQRKRATKAKLACFKPNQGSVLVPGKE
jgi:hypothetical protein